MMVKRPLEFVESLQMPPNVEPVIHYDIVWFQINETFGKGIFHLDGPMIPNKGGTNKGNGS